MRKYTGVESFYFYPALVYLFTLLFAFDYAKEQKGFLKYDFIYIETVYTTRRRRVLMSNGAKISIRRSPGSQGRPVDKK